MNDAERSDVIVVGAGIVGAACAYYLAGEGLSVQIVESGFPGCGTTATGMGHLVVMDDSEAQFELTAYSRDLWIELGDELPAACEDDACGTLWIAADDEELELARRKAEFYSERDIRAELISGDDLERLEPNLRPGLAGALRVPDDRVIYPPGANRWLIDRAVDLGASLRDGWEVERVGEGVVEGTAGKLRAGVVVHAAGSRAVDLVPDLPVEPRRGHLVITDRYPGFCHHQTIELGYLKSAHTLTAESVAFNVQPRKTGQLLIGSSRELVGWDATINRRVVRRMIERALEFMPGLAGLSALRTWIGFRPTTPDKLPLIGRWDPVPGLWIAAGHEGLGITTALGTGRLLADLVSGRRPAIAPEPFDPMRAAG